MAALEPDPLAHTLRAAVERPRRAVAVADLPVVDLIRLLLTIGAQDDFVLLRRERVRDGRQRLVLDLHGLGAVIGRRASFRKDRGHFLVLEQDLADGEHHLLVQAVERRQPPEAGRLEIATMGDVQARTLAAVGTGDR